jgi:hypothetical protein
MYMNDQPQRLKEEKRCPAHRIAAPRGGWERVMDRLISSSSAPAENYGDNPISGLCLSSMPLTPLVVMAADSMLRRADRAQAGSLRLHDQADYGASASLAFEASS